MKSNAKSLRWRAGCLAAALCLPVPVQAARQWQLDAVDVERLRALAPEASAEVLLQNTPADEGRESDRESGKQVWSFQRIEVYADDARLIVIDKKGERSMERSPALHFIGLREGARMALSLLPDGSGQGLLVDAEGTWSLTPQLEKNRLRLQAESVDAPLPDGSLPESDCLGGLEGHAHHEHGSALLSELSRSLSASAATSRPAQDKVAASRRAMLAIDTDNELLSQKFNNSASAAGTYLAALVASMNAIYEQEITAGGGKLRLQIGTQIIRTTPDPYGSTSATGISAQLNEFSAYWMNNYASTARAAAVMISGKSASNNSASGIAWVVESGSFCDAKGSTFGSNTFGHYAVNRVFKHTQNSVAMDAPLVAHELGHVFGLHHTHCTGSNGSAPTGGNTLDRCFSGESGCYSGPTSCPSAGQGTLMSYCHISGCGTGNSSRIHSVQANALNTRLNSQPTSCIAPLGGGGGGPIFSNGFE